VLPAGFAKPLPAFAGAGDDPTSTFPAGVAPATGVTPATGPGAVFCTGLGISESSHSSIPNDPNAKTTIAIRTPYRNAFPWNGAPPGIRLSRRAAASRSSIFSNAATSGAGGSPGGLLGSALSSMARNTVAYTAPFGIFILFLSLSQGLEAAHIAPGGLAPIYLVFPLQTVVCAAALIFYGPRYRLHAPRNSLLAVSIGIFACALWVSPQVLFHQPPRLVGFNPGIFAGRPVLYWAEIIFRFLRLVLVVPFLEEIFWRGFLLRFFINEDFEAVPFGTYGPLANAVVALGFMLEHSLHDWPAALATGLLYNMVAYRSRSLSSCILAHAITNALLGAFIMFTAQWGFW
jgi:CAAX prenyl protease-like protein